MNIRVPSLVAVAVFAGFAVYVFSYIVEAYSETADGMPDTVTPQARRGLIKQAKQAARDGGRLLKGAQSGDVGGEIDTGRP
jgi:hypothetical protein